MDSKKDSVTKTIIKDEARDIGRESISENNSFFDFYENEWDKWYEEGFVENQKAKRYRRDKRKPEQ